MDYFKGHIVAYFFTVLIFVVGVVIGALAVKTLPAEQKTELIGYLKIFFSGLTQDGTAGVGKGMLGPVMLNNLKTVALIWVFGFTIVGIPFVLFILFTRGFVIGFTVGFLVNEYVMKGLLFALASVLPHNFLAVPALLVLCVSSISFSLMLVKRKTQGKINLWYEAIGYSLLCLVMLAVMSCAALIEVYISPVFMKLLAGFILGG
jgi:stage II sporulation protein M